MDNPQEIQAAAAAQLDDLHGVLVQRGFGQRVGFGDRPALLVVDLINGFTDTESSLGSDLDDVVEASEQVLTSAHRASIPVVFTTTAYDPALEEAGVWARKIPSSSWLVDGSRWVEVDERLTYTENDMLLVKKYASAFFGTDLASRLVSRAVDTLIIVGATTSGCVRASAVDACSIGLRPIVVRQAVGDRSPLSHLVSLFDVDVKYGDVVELDDALNYLGQLPAAVPSASSAQP